MTFGKGKDGYLGNSSSPVFQSMSNAALVSMMWVTLILGWSTLMATADQHKVLLKGQAISLFVSQILLTFSQGEMIPPEQVKAGGIGTFLCIVVSILGAN